MSTFHLAELPPPWQAVGYAVVADDTLAVLATDVDLAGAQRQRAAALPPDAPSFPPNLSELLLGGSGLIWTTKSSAWSRGPTFPLETPFPHFARFGDGRWLVVASRSDGEANARVMAPDGRLLARFTLGDGIEHVAIDAEDRIWVGWFDEGIFGNDGWREAELDRPPSSNGIACFTSDGRPLALPILPDDAGMIADCYALNAAGPGAWICPYTDFPLVRFVPGEPTRWWRTSVAPHAVAVDERHALAAGGYTKDANRLTLMELAGEGVGEDATILASWGLPLRRLPKSDDEWSPVWHRPDLLVGRGDILHFVDDGRWIRWSVQDLVVSSLLR